MADTWTFNDAVATRFDEEARTHIPDYEHVITRTLNIARESFPDKRARIIDVGSALGHTLEILQADGFNAVYGVDSSSAMLRESRVQRNLILSETFPSAHGPFDMIIANWTLHFIHPRHRGTYIKDIFRALNPGGIFVLTEKIDAGPDIHDAYINFKRSMGVSEDEIVAKTASLVGVLYVLPDAWYRETLRNAGFTNIVPVHDAYCFRTYVCHRD